MKFLKMNCTENGVETEQEHEDEHSQNLYGLFVVYRYVYVCRWYYYQFHYCLISEVQVLYCSVL